MESKSREDSVEDATIPNQDSSPDNKQVYVRDGALTYEVWQGVRTFWCKGKIQIGPQPVGLLIVTLLINVCNLISLGFSWIDYYIDDGNLFPLIAGLILWAIVNYFLFKVAFTDPGLIPKQPDDDHTLKWRSHFRNSLILDGL